MGKIFLTPPNKIYESTFKTYVNSYKEANDSHYFGIYEKALEDFGKKPRLFVVMSENDKIAFVDGKLHYDISTPEELKKYDLSGWYSKELNKTQGVWKIPFDANYKVTNKKIKLDEKIKIDDEESIVESVSISPISIELNLNGKNPNNGYVNLKVFDKSGSEIFLSGGSNMSSKTKATYIWTFMGPVDINAINKIVIEGNEIILKN